MTSIPSLGTSPSTLETHLGYWLRMVSNHVSHAFSQRLADRGVTAAEWVVLRWLWDREEMPPSDLAGQLGMTRGAISKLADRLEAKALLKRKSNPDDRRYQTVALTAAGREIVPILAALADENDRIAFEVLTDAERGALLALLQQFARWHRLTVVPSD